MCVQAAANASDKECYDDTLKQMQVMMGQTSVSDALSKGLLRTFASNDYPAWAIAIVRLSAATIGDEKLFLELEAPLKAAIEGAKEAKTMPELLLAQVNQSLAIERQKLTLTEYKSTVAAYIN